MMPDAARPDTRSRLEQILSERILVLDGAMGTMIHAHKPTEADFRGDAVPQPPRSCCKNCIDVLVLTQPRMIEEIHRAYLEAGADIIETNTFGANADRDGRLRPGGARPRAQPGRRRVARRAADEFTGATPSSRASWPAPSGRRTRQLSIAGNVNDPG